MEKKVVLAPGLERQLYSCVSSPSSHIRRQSRTTGRSDSDGHSHRREATRIGVRSDAAEDGSRISWPYGVIPPPPMIEPAMEKCLGASTEQHLQARKKGFRFLRLRQEHVNRRKFVSRQRPK